MRAIVFWLTLAAILLALNVAIARRQGLLSPGAGTTLRLKLATYNHDYFVRGNTLTLHFEVAQQVSPYLSPIQPPSGPPAGVAPAPTLESAGCLVVTLDANQVANFVRVHAGEPLQPGEHLLRYRMRNSWMIVGVESFTCEAGHEVYYAAAQYAEFRVAPNGDSVLVRLLNPKFEPLGPKK
jgi:uncharacterized membrane-anchored protein